MLPHATTKPGDKYRSIKNPAVYEGLRRRGMSKSRAARISNAQSHKDAGIVAGAPLHGPGGLLSTPSLGTRRKRKGRRWGQRLKCSCGVTFKAPTGQPGELLEPGVRRIRGNLCNVHGRYGPCDAGAAGKPKRGKKPPRAAKPKQTPEQRATARDAERQQNADAVAKRMQDSDTGLSPSGVAAMRGLASGVQPDKARGDGLVKMGLAERGLDGSYRMSATGRAAMNAMAAGDYQRAVDTIARAGDTAAARRGRQGAAAARRTEAATRRQAVQARREQAQRQREERARQSAKKKPSAGAGKKPANPADEVAARPAPKPVKRRASSGGALPSAGGSSGTSTPKPKVPAKAPPPEKPKLAPALTAAATALSEGADVSDEQLGSLIRNGLVKLNKNGDPVLTATGQRATMKADSSTPGDYLVVEDLEKSTTWHLQVKRNGKPDHGLMGSAWAALHGGYRGNKYEGPGKTEAIAKLKKLYASEKMDTPAEKSFIVFKDHTGAHRWLARTTTAYRDRDQEIISSDALDQDSQRMTALKAFGPLRYWHVGQPDPLDVAAPWGPGLDIGDCDYSVLIGRTRVESGTFRDPAIAQKVAQQADRYELSPGFFHPLDQPDNGGVFHAIRTFERSIVPTAYGRASNLFTGLAVKEQRMDVNEMEKRFKTAIADLGLNAEQAQSLGAQLVQTEKDAGAMIDPITRQPGIAFKSDAVSRAAGLHAESGPASGEFMDDANDITINGVVYTVKAAPPPMDTAAVEDVEDVVTEEPVEEEMTDEYIGDMSWDEFAAKLTELLAPVLKMQDMVKNIGDMHGELKGMYGGVAQKDDARGAELITLKAQYAELATKIAQIEGDQPATILPDEVAAALKSAGPLQPAKPEDPATAAALSDPARPFAWLGMKTFPELYQNGEST